MRPFRLAGAVGAILLAAGGCGPSFRSTQDAPGNPCEVVRGSSVPEDTITVVVTDSITSSVPFRVPFVRNSAEQLMFDLQYQTLLTVDCSNREQPGLAQSWDRKGRRWTFRLRPDARFWDGTTVTAADVVQGWRYSGEPSESLVAVDDRTLEVRFARRVPDARFFSSSGLAVMKMDARYGLSVGTGPYRTDDNVARGDLFLHPSLGENDPTIHLVMTDRRDVRDMMVGGVELVITSDPELIEYAAGQPRFTTTALAWNRTYVLLAPARADALREGRTVAGLPPAFTDALAKDAVRAEARGPATPVWWKDTGECTEKPTLPGLRESGVEVRRILFDVNDATARDLAERLVAVAAMDPRQSAEAEAVVAAVPGLDAAKLVAAGVGTERLDASLWGGGEVAYVVALPHAVPDACVAASELASRAPWLVNGVALADVLIPLVDTRPHAIVAHGCAGLVLNGLGGVLIETGTGNVKTSP
jgi:Bacterial extracellular solute-binding proteins, family 5 Middle